MCIEARSLALRDTVAAVKGMLRESTGEEPERMVRPPPSDTPPCRPQVLLRPSVRRGAPRPGLFKLFIEDVRMTRQARVRLDQTAFGKQKYLQSAQERLKE